MVVLPWSRTGPGLCFQHVVVDGILPNPFRRLLLVPGRLRVLALLRTRRYPDGDVGPSRHDPGERPACWVPWLAQRPRRPLVRPKGPRAPFFIRKGGIDNNNSQNMPPEPLHIFGSISLHVRCAPWMNGCAPSWSTSGARRSSIPAPATRLLLLLLMPPFLMKYGARGPFGRTSGLHGFCVCKPGHPASWALTRDVPARPHDPLRVPSRPQQREHVVSQELVVVAERQRMAN